MKVHMETRAGLNLCGQATMSRLRWRGGTLVRAGGERGRGGDRTKDRARVTCVKCLGRLGSHVPWEATP